MLIVSNDGRLVVDSDHIAKVEAGDKLVTAYTSTNVNMKPDVYLGKYDNRLQTGRALNMLIDAWLSNDEIFHMPDIGDPMMKVEDIMHGSGGFSERKPKTTGKTK